MVFEFKLAVLEIGVGYGIHLINCGEDRTTEQEKSGARIV